MKHTNTIMGMRTHMERSSIHNGGALRMQPRLAQWAKAADYS